MQLRTALFGLCTAAFILGLGPVASVWAQTDAGGTAQTTEEKIKAGSLLEQAPIIGNINRRYFKFYGHPYETVRGGILERSHLTNDWAGWRDKLLEAGVYFDAGLTQNFMGNAGGGVDEQFRYTGSLDLWLNLDTAKLTKARWPGGTIFLHGENRWNDGIQEYVGSAIPPVFDDTMPDALDDSGFYLSEYYLVQALSPKVSVWIGQMNGAGLVDGNAFANSEKHQFMNTALVDNPALGAFAPYTAFTAAAIYLPTPQHVLIGSVMDANGSVHETVAESYSTDETVFVGSYAWLPDFGGRPGRYQVLGAYTNKDYPEYGLSNRLELARELAGIDPVLNDETDNYIVTLNFNQYLHVADKERMTGWGLFGRFAWTPDDRNIIDQFYSFGVGGRGLLIPGRDLDFWGLGWAGTHLSDDWRQQQKVLTSAPLLGKPGVDLDSFEHVIEAFYNIALTPAVHLTLDAQFIINPVVAQIGRNLGGDVDNDSHAWVLGTRLQIDF